MAKTDLTNQRQVFVEEYVRSGDHLEAAKKAGYKYIMTSVNCLTGTDRVAEAASKINANIYVNVQGDEPTIDPIDIKKVIRQKKKFPEFVVCGYDKLNKYEDPKNKNIPKVVLNRNNELIYISRSVVPGSKFKVNKNKIFKQVCIYAFNKKQLKFFKSKNKKSHIEEIEDIEIIRFFDLNIKIKMIRLNSNSVAVDEIKDVKKAEKVISEKWKKKKNMF